MSCHEFAIDAAGRDLSKKGYTGAGRVSGKSTLSLSCAFHSALKHLGTSQPTNPYCMPHRHVNDRRVFVLVSDFCFVFMMILLNVSATKCVFNLALVVLVTPPTRSSIALVIVLHSWIPFLQLHT